MRENTDQNNWEYGRFLNSDNYWKEKPKKKNLDQTFIWIKIKYMEFFFKMMSFCLM